MVKFWSNSEKVSNTYLRSKKRTENREVLDIERKKSIILLSVLAIATVMSGIAITAFATDTVDEETQFPAFFTDRKFGCGRGRGRGGMFGAIEVSEEYVTSVIEIAESDTDVQDLLNSGYNFLTDEDGSVIVRPIMKTYVDAEGNVDITATTAVVNLTPTEEGTGRAVVWVDLDTDSVTKIEILTRTVIEKDAGTVEVITP